MEGVSHALRSPQETRTVGLERMLGGEVRVQDVLSSPRGRREGLPGLQSRQQEPRFWIPLPMSAGHGLGEAVGDGCAPVSWAVEQNKTVSSSNSDWSCVPLGSASGMVSRLLSPSLCREGSRGSEAETSFSTSLLK